MFFSFKKKEVYYIKYREIVLILKMKYLVNEMCILIWLFINSFWCDVLVYGLIYFFKMLRYVDLSMFIYVF